MSAAENRARLHRATLEEHAALVRQSVDALRLSLSRCEAIGIREGYSPEELIQFEALGARFARTADRFTQKLLKSLVLVLREDAPSFLDRARLAEKLGVIERADDLVAVRDLRNLLAHEYATTDLKAVFQSTLALSHTLLKLIDSTARYLREQLPPVPA